MQPSKDIYIGMEKDDKVSSSYLIYLGADLNSSAYPFIVKKDGDELLS